MFDSKLADIPVKLDWVWADADLSVVRVVMIWIGGEPVRPESFSTERLEGWETEILESLRS